nr:MAG TPA: hypothetical protein [Caudoviricetes sp.]
MSNFQLLFDHPAQLNQTYNTDQLAYFLLEI